jgi:Glycosyl hydrolase family 115
MTPASFVMDGATVFAVPEPLPVPVRHALDIFARDFAKVFGTELRTGPAGEARVRLVLGPDPALTGPEAFALRFDKGAPGPVLTLAAADDLGLVYGLLHLSQVVLGVDPFWFWADREPEARQRIAIPAVDYLAPKPRVRFRGWFVNDEVCLIGWSDTYPPSAAVWAPVFETLLRLGGNLVIPGTDLPRDGVHWRLAAEMGLYVTHHHAEPLGAEMFFRVHPYSDASYATNPDLFEALWQEAIDRQRSDKLVWTLGFRGQGDCPFWDQDPSFDTPEKRGELITRAIRRQHEMLCAAVENPACLTYLYGEITELYREGHIAFPPGVAKIWSDNGYGRMVTRRQGNHNLRVPSLPLPSDEGPHGLYYHVTFHDLQASSHLVMLPVETELLAEELECAFDATADEVLLVNCGNVRPHVYHLDTVARLWRGEIAEVSDGPETFARRYFPSAPDAAAACLRRYFDASIAYGPAWDDKAGDEFYHHPARSLIGRLMRGEADAPAEDLLWATGDRPFDAQVAWFRDRCGAAVAGLAALQDACDAAAAALTPAEAVFFRDLLGFQVRLHHSGCRGVVLLCEAIEAYRDGRYPQAFVGASQSLWAYSESLAAMQAAEHGKWRGFFSADWLTNVDSTIYSLDALRKHIRMFGDNPDYFRWHKAYLMPESEKKIYLENTHRKPPSDDDLAEGLSRRFGM